jgi:hypothetical protein
MYAFQAIMIAGGQKPGDKTKVVLEYDIDSNSYNTIQMLPDPKSGPTMVRKDNYMYLFGGSKSKEVLRIELSLFTDWEKLENMKEEIHDPLVVPYN